MATVTQKQPSYQQEVLRQRLPIVILGMFVVSVVLIWRVMSFQFPQDPRVQREFAAQRDANAGSVQRFEAPRGTIYDRNGNTLAVNTIKYLIGISPNLVSSPASTAASLAAILNRDELEIYELLTSEESYVVLEPRADPEVWREIRDLELLAIQAERVHQRFYTQGPLAGQVIGFVAGTGEDARGYEGVEGFYQQELAGLVRDQEVSNIPFDLPEDLSGIGEGADLVLTIDRDVQHLVETELELALASTGAVGGTIIVMNPRNGDILAMASEPSFDPNLYFDVRDETLLRNPAIRDVYEPGSVFKVITVAAALDMGAITPQWTYNDQGGIDVGGRRIQNWDRQAYGVVDTTGVLVNSLNVGATEIALQMVRTAANASVEDDTLSGYNAFYEKLDDFGIGKPTRVDLQGEEAGILKTPYSLAGDWSESDLATNSFGQGVSVTSLQMLTAVNAIANDGLIMQPRVVHQIIDGENIIEARPTVTGRAISAETARIVRDMMEAVVRDGLDERAQVPGYRVAGKTGTAQIPDVIGYLPNEFIMSFVGFLPADDPQISILVMLDRPTSGNFASQTAAPVFSRLASRLVTLLEIPRDDIRYVLEAEGVDVSEQNQ